MGPLNDAMKSAPCASRGDIKYEIQWTTLAEYLHYLEKRGVSCNVASFIGATTIREHVSVSRTSSPHRSSSSEMRELVRREMEDGRARHRHVVDLSAGVLREDGGADRAVQSRRAVSGQIHFAPAQRREPAARSAR